jgi:hypothetical protein
VPVRKVGDLVVLLRCIFVCLIICFGCFNDLYLFCLLHPGIPKGSLDVITACEKPLLQVIVFVFEHLICSVLCINIADAKGSCQRKNVVKSIKAVYKSIAPDRHVVNVIITAAKIA